MSGKPVMEGKGLLFKIYGGIDVFDIEVAEEDPDKFCEAVEKIAPPLEVSTLRISKHLSALPSKNG